MELRNIRSFVRIAEEKSFTRAAEKLNYAQSTVTAQIRQLEEELGVLLFDRVGRQIYLTDAGRKFLDCAYDMLRLEERAARIGSPGREPEGTLRIGLIQSLQNHLLLPRAIAFRRRYPKVSLVVEEANSAKLVGMLGRNEIDLAYLFDTRVTDENLVVMEEHEESMYFAAPADHPLSREAAPRLEDILALPYLATEEELVNSRVLRQCLADRGLRYHSTFQVGNPDVILRMIAAGEGISWLPRYVLADMWEKGQISVIDYQFPEAHLYRQICRHRDKWVSDCMRAWMTLGPAGEKA
ncbi:MAG: LysR family transcriptional regulator [Desulfovibrionaceae bacterium]|nr:LysR family transcriptional regulator [Desulfovibrionaceae bacterium]